MHPNVYSSIFLSIIDNGQDKDQPKCTSTDEWIKKMWYIYPMEYYLAIKKNEILPFVTTQMDREGIMLSEISQKSTVCYHLHVEYKKQTNK